MSRSHVSNLTMREWLKAVTFLSQQGMTIELLHRIADTPAYAKAFVSALRVEPKKAGHASSYEKFLALPPPKMDRHTSLDSVRAGMHSVVFRLMRSAGITSDDLLNAPRIPDRVRYAIRCLHETIYQVPLDGDEHVPRRQVSWLKILNRINHWGITDEEFNTALQSVPSLELRFEEFLVLVPSLHAGVIAGDRRVYDGPERTLRELWYVASRLQLSSELQPIFTQGYGKKWRLLHPDKYLPGLRWEVLRFAEILSAQEEMPSASVLAFAVFHPRVMREISRGFATQLSLHGYILKDRAAVLEYDSTTACIRLRAVRIAEVSDMRVVQRLATQVG